MTTEELKNLLATWPGIAILVTLLVQVAKKLSAWVDNKREPTVAVVLGVALACTAKGAGLMAIGAGWTGWAIAIIGGIIVGGVGGQIHDYAWNPAVGVAKDAISFVKGLSGHGKKDGSSKEKKS